MPSPAAEALHSSASLLPNRQNPAVHTAKNALWHLIRRIGGID
jgi:hypothetical protein